MPTLSAAPATDNTDQQAVTLRSGSSVDEDAEDGARPDTTQQELTSPKELWETSDQYGQCGNHTSQETIPIYDNGGSHALTEPPKRPTHPFAYSDNSVLAPARNSGDLQPLVMKRAS